MTSKWMLLAIGMVAAAAVLAGCNTQSVDFSNDDVMQDDPLIVPELIARANSPIDDVPVPIGFELGEKQTLEFGAGSARYLQHRYSGKADKWELKRFYKRQMQIHRWQFVNYVVAEGEFTLEYEKDTERCRVMISEGNWPHSTKIKVRLWTSGQITDTTPPTPPRTVSRTASTAAAAVKRIR